MARSIRLYTPIRLSGLVGMKRKISLSLLLSMGELDLDDPQANVIRIKNQMTRVIQMLLDRGVKKIVAILPIEKPGEPPQIRFQKHQIAEFLKFHTPSLLRRLEVSYIDVLREFSARGATLKFRQIGGQQFNARQSTGDIVNAINTALRQLTQRTA